MKEWMCNNNRRNGFRKGNLYREASNGCLIDDYGDERLLPVIYNINLEGSFTLYEPILENK